MPKTTLFFDVKSRAVKAIMLLTITHLTIYIFLNNEEAGNVYLFCF